MISVLIETRGETERLARTLAALVSASVDGDIREVLVRLTDQRGRQMILALVDQAGCVLLEGVSAREAVERCRNDVVLVVEEGAVLERGWNRDAANAISVGQLPARFTELEAGRFQFLARIFNRPKGFPAVLISKSALLADLVNGVELADALSKLRPHRLHARISRAPEIAGS